MDRKPADVKKGQGYLIVSLNVVSSVFRVNLMLQMCSGLKTTSEITSVPHPSETKCSLEVQQNNNC